MLPFGSAWYRSRPGLFLFLGFLLGLLFVACSAEGEPSGSSSHIPTAGNGEGASGTNPDPNATGGSDTNASGVSGAAGKGASAGSGGASGPSGASGSDGGSDQPPAGGSPAFDPCQSHTVNDTPRPEQCDNGLDDDLNGFVDENCPCVHGNTQPCYAGPPSEAALPNCHMGIQTCTGESEFPGWGPCQDWGCEDFQPPPEACDDGIDNDCDGQTDEGCTLDVPVNIDGDCVYASCPPQAPYPSGCNIIMSGGDSRGCVANLPGSSLVYFQEGDQCPPPPPFDVFADAGHIDGTLFCSTALGAEPLNADNCAINKPDPSYPADASGCAPVGL